MKIRINTEWDLDKIEFNLKNPKKGDTYAFFKLWPPPNLGSEEYCKIVIVKIEDKNLFYYKNLVKFEIPISELENIIQSHSNGFIEFYNQYEYQNYIKTYIEKQKSEQSL